MNARSNIPSTIIAGIVDTSVPLGYNEIITQRALPKEKVMDKKVAWENLSADEKKKELFLQQKHTLDLFLERHAITQAQYNKSLGDLRDKMGMRGVE